jgi:hypothetical protein
MNKNQGRGHSGRQKVTKVVTKETNSPTAKRIITEDLERSSKKQRSPVNKSPNPQPPSELTSNFQPRPFSFQDSLNPQNVHIQAEQNTKSIELLNNDQPTNNSQRKPHKKKVQRQKPKQKQNNLPENQTVQDRRETDRVISEKSQFSLPQTPSENNYNSERKNSKPLPIPLNESQIPVKSIYPSQPQLFAEQTPNTTLQQMPILHTPISVLQQQTLVTPPSPMNVETRPSTLQHPFLSPLFIPPQSAVSINEKTTSTTTTVLNLPQSPVTPPSPMNVETRPELLKLPPPQPIFTLPNFQIQQLPMNFPNTRPMQQFIPKPPWFGIKVNSLYPVNTLHTEILQFCQYIKSTSVEATLREKVIQRLGDVISNIWPMVQMKTFGSFETKLYLPTRFVFLFFLF